MVLLHPHTGFICKDWFDTLVHVPKQISKCSEPIITVYVNYKKQALQDHVKIGCEFDVDLKLNNLFYAIVNAQHRETLW